MYGTVAKIKVKPGQAQEVARMMEKFNQERSGKVQGALHGFLYQMDEDPNKLIIVAVFQDHDTYEANADDPEQDRWYQELRSFLEEDPEWNDGEIINAWSRA